MEESFPRGGQLRAVKAKFNAKRKSTASRSGPKKVAKYEANIEQEDFELSDRCWTKELADSCCEVGLLSVGCVKTFLGTGFLVELPSKLRAVLPLNAVSRPFRDHCGEADSASLDTLFSPSDLICVKVTGKSERQLSSGKVDKLWSVATDPVEVNGHLAPMALRQMAVISAAVLSVEDKGYVMDIGFENVYGFLPFDDDAEDRFTIGKVLPCSVVSSASPESRVIRLCPLRQLLKHKAIKPLPADFPEDHLMPGVTVKATVVRRCAKGLMVRLTPDRLAYVPFSQSSTIGSHINVMVTYCVPQSIMLGVSAKPTLLRRAELDAGFPSLCSGHVCSGTVVARDSTGVTFKMADQRYGHCKKKRLNEKFQKNLKKYYKVDSVHSVRIVGLSGLQLSYNVSCLQRDLSQKFSSLEEAKPGSVVPCIVREVKESVVLTRVYQVYHGVIPKMHCSDAPSPVINPEKYPVGREIKVRILEVDLGRQRLLLTAKRSLVKSTLPPLADYSRAMVGEQFDGHVVRFYPKGILVAFYGGVKGFLSNEQLFAAGINEPADQAYRIGDAIRVVISEADPEKEKICLSLPGAVSAVVPEGTEVIAEEDTKVNLQKPIHWCDFRVHNGEVLGVQPSGLEVRLENGAVGFVPKESLTDCLGIGSQLLELYQLGDTVSGLVILKPGEKLLCTMQPLIVQAVAEDWVPRSLDQLEVGMMVYGVLERTKGKDDYFVKLPGKLRGFVRKKGPRGNSELWNAIGASVAGRVDRVDTERRRFSVDLSLRNSLTDGLDTSLHLLKRYLLDMDRLSRLPSKASLKALQMGRECEVTVVDRMERDLICKEVSTGVQVYIHGRHLCGASSQYSVDSRHTAVVLFVDYAAGRVAAAVRPKLRRKCQRMCNAKAEDVIKLGKQRLNASVVAIEANVITLVLSGHGSGLLCYMPGRLHYNDAGTEVGRHYINQTIKVVPEDYYEHRLLVSSALNRTVYGSMKGSSLVLKGHVAVPVAPRVKVKGVSVVTGGVYRAVVTGKFAHFLKLSIAGRHVGLAFATELSDDIEDGSCPMDVFQTGNLVTVRVLRMQMLRRKDKLKRRLLAYCTLRESKIFQGGNCEEQKKDFKVGQRVLGVLDHCREGGWIVQINPWWKGVIDKFRLGSTAERITAALESFKANQVRHFYVVGIQVQEHRLVLAVQKNVDLRISPGVCTVGVPNGSACNAGIMFNLPGGCSGVVPFTELSDDYDQAAEVLSQLKEGSFVNVFSVEREGKFCLLSLRASRFRNSGTPPKDPVVRSVDEVSNLRVLRGFVGRASPMGVEVLLGYEVHAFVPVEKISKGTDLEEAFPTNMVVTVAVDFSKSTANRLYASMLPSDIDSGRSRSPLGKRQKIVTKPFGNMNEDKSCVVDAQCPWLQIKKSKDSQSSEAATLNGAAKNSGFTWNPPRFSMKNLLNVSLENSAENVESDEDAPSGSFVHRTSGKSKGKTQDLALEEEHHILEKEMKLLDTSRGLEDSHDYDRALLASPNSSALWTSYIAYFVKINDIDKARAVARKALRTILPREETERFNIWLAMLNLENEFGSAESMDDVVRNALEVNDRFQIYTQLLRIYERSEKLQEGDNVVSELLKKYRSSFDCWIAVCQYYMKTDRAELARKTMDRSFLSMPKSTHVDLMSRYAQMEFKLSGNIERGCTLFEKILSEKPKRGDVWMVFIDLMVKYRGIEAARTLLERVTSIKMSTHKIHNFYKKWLDLETRFGTEKDVENVRQRATDYVNRATSFHVEDDSE